MIELPAPPDALADRLDAFTRAVRIGEGRLPADVLTRAQRVIERAEVRRSLSPDHTVVALAGSTGSGKSSLFNALTGVDLSAVGIRRPTTGAVHACVWGMDGAEDLLDWLGVPPEHRVARDTVLDTTPSPLTGLVLLDLPDHDSADASHRDQVDRLLELVDGVVWVMDPQKYADRVVHREFLQPMAAHSGVVVVALNQVDRLDAVDVEACEADLRRLLVEDGLGEARLVTTSATTGTGADELRELLVQMVQQRRLAEQRILADVVTESSQLDVYCADDHEAAGVGSRVREELVHSLVESAGVTTLGTAVADVTRRRGLTYTSHPVAKLVHRFRREPSLRLPGGTELTGVAAEQPPAAAPLPLAQVDGALRAVSTATARDLPHPWPGLVRTASRSRADKLVDVVDDLLAGTDVSVGKAPPWWRLAWVAQWLLLAGVLAGVFLLGAALVGVGSVVLAGAVAVGSLALGVGLDLVGRAAVRVTARRRGELVVGGLRDEISRTAREHVVEPVENELDAYSEIRRELSVARGA